MAKKDYTNWDRKDLIKEIEQLRKRKKYGIVWEDKLENVVEQCKTELPILEEVRNKEIIRDKNKSLNLLIEGDNYHALSVLNYTHKGKIDVIYIDPPYNTGARDWKYNNDYVDENDKWRHSKWLSMMNNRLKIAKNLLKKDGVLICMIDKWEDATLQLLLTEIFPGHELATVVVEHNPKGLPSRNFSFSHEYAHFVFPKGKSVIGKNPRGKEDTRNLRRAGRASYRTERPTMFYPIYVKDDKVTRIGTIPDLNFNPVTRNVKQSNGEIEIWPIDDNGKERRWHFGLDSINGHIDRIEVKKNKKGDLQLYVTAVPSRYKTVWTGGDLDAGKYGTTLVKNIIGKEFPFPKSLLATERCLETIIYSRPNALVLDFFAGSGTTGHAVLEMNKKYGGERKFILCTNNENNIAEEITYPRIKNVIDGYEYSGKTKIVLFEMKITEKNLREVDLALDDIDNIRENNKNRHDKFEIKIEDNCLRLYGITNVDERMIGLGGNLKYFRTSFVPADPTDKNKTTMTEKATEMLCVKEDTFEEVKSTKQYKIFRNKKRYTGIVLDHQAIDDFKKEISKIDGKFSLYIFSLSDDTFDEEFEDMNKKVKLSPIPEAILRVYRRIFK